MSRGSNDFCLGSMELQAQLDILKHQAGELISAIRKLDRRFLRWADWEKEALRDLYPLMTNRELAVLFDRTPSAVKKMALTDLRCPPKLPQVIQRAHDECAEQRAATQFKKGHRPYTWLPVGTEVIDAYGYRKRKVRDGAKPAVYNFEFVHVLLWEQHNGPVPRGHVVRFKNGDKTDIRIENLELLDWADNLRRNSRHRYPPEINHLIGMKAQLTRRINKMERKREKQD